MKKKNAAILSLILSSICFIVLIQLYNHVGHLYLSSVLWINRLEKFDKTALIYLVISLFSGLAFLNIYLFLRRKMNRLFLSFEFLCYIAALLVFLLLKSPGTQGVNLDFSRFIMDLEYSTFEIVMNTVLFIPIGLLLGNKKRIFTMIFLSITFILSIEITQYLFKLGIFDVIDIATNFTGVLIGYLIARIYNFFSK